MRKGVLYVEDDNVTRELIVKNLRREYENVYHAPDGREGLKLFREHNPAVVITDLAMPDIDGFTMIKEMREVSQDVTIIVATAYREEAQKIEDHVDLILFKPLAKANLIDAVRKYYTED